jgi:hypothetical protein
MKDATTPATAVVAPVPVRVVKAVSVVDTKQVTVKGDP